jgi:hypothetical protein
MSGNARGQLKEELEGIHRNIDWVRVHAQKGQKILDGTHPEIAEAFDGLIKEMDVLDELFMHIYATV